MFLTVVLTSLQVRKTLPLLKCQALWNSPLVGGRVAGGVAHGVGEADHVEEAQDFLKFKSFE